MDRRLQVLPRWLLLPLVVVAWAGLPREAAHAAPPASSAEEPSVRVVLSDMSDAGPAMSLPILMGPLVEIPADAISSPWPRPVDQSPQEPGQPTQTSMKMDPGAGPSHAFRTATEAGPAFESLPPAMETWEAPADEPVAANADRPRTLADPSGSLLLPPETLAARTEQLERIAQEADRQTRRGFELAGRGACFAARSEFVMALRLVAQGLDTEQQTDRHSRALAAGLAAIDESSDFIPGGSRLEADLDVSAVIEGHRTPVLKDVGPEGLTPLAALKVYLTFAQEQLAVAGGHELAGSMALHALGKLHAAQSLQDAGGVRAAEAKAVAFYQAALLAYPENSMAANDLGVLLARCGRYVEAEAALRYSLSLQPQSTGWHNLAVVYQQLGRADLGRQAEQISQAARAAETGRPTARPAQGLVQWVDPGTLGQPSGQDLGVPLPTNPSPRPSVPAQVGQSTQQPGQGSLMGWLPWGKSDERR